MYNRNQYQQQLPYGQYTPYQQQYPSYPNQYAAYGIAQFSHATASVVAKPPNVDFSAPVIHFGTSNPAPYKSNGINSTPTVSARNPVEFVQPTGPLQPPSRDQQLRTLFVGSINEVLDDYWIERILKSVAKLKSWKRASDAHEVPRNYGFAEYDDPEHVHRAYTILKDLQIDRQSPSNVVIKLQVIADEVTKMFVADYLEHREIKNPQRDRGMLLSATSSLNKVLADIRDPEFKRPENMHKSQGTEKSVTITEEEDQKAVTILLSTDDELGDIPQDQRDLIAREISSFRERSAQRDEERARKIEDVERRRAEFERQTRAAVSNRSSLVVKLGSATVNSTDHTNSQDIGSAGGMRERVRSHSTEQEVMTDQELEQHRQQRKASEIMVAFIEREKRWQNREKARASAADREGTKEKEEKAREDSSRESAARRLADWDDDSETSRSVEEYYRDRANWSRHRAALRTRETDADKLDQIEDSREMVNIASNLDFTPVRSPIEGLVTHNLLDTSEEVYNKPAKAVAGTAPVRLSLIKKSVEAKRGLLNNEIILEDEDDQNRNERRKVLMPVQYEETKSAEQADERQERLRDIIAKIPSERSELWRWPVKWELLQKPQLLDKLRAFVEKKCVEAIGVQEQDLIVFVMEFISSHGRAEDLEKEMESAIGDADEASLFVIKIWRFLIILLETVEA